MKLRCAEEVGQDPSDEGSTFLHFRRLIFIGESTRHHMSLHHLPSARLRCSRYLSLMRSTIANCALAFDRDLVDRDLPDQRASICSLNPTSHELPRHLPNIETHYSHTKKKIEFWCLYKGGHLIAFASTYGPYDAPILYTRYSGLLCL